MKISVLIILITMSQTFLSTCFAQGENKTQQVTEQRKVDAFDNIFLSGCNISVSYSNAPTLELIGSKSCIGMIETEVVHNSLTVKFSENHRENHDCKVKINIGMSSLTAVEVNGGGDIFIAKGLREEEDFHCTINGGGKADVSNVKVRSFYASVNGGGKITANAAESLNGNINGGGVIEYYGDPKVISAVTGGGRITRK